MRDKEVTIPKGECVESLCKELEYFGIEYESTKISSNDNLNIPESIKNFRAYLEKFETMNLTHTRNNVETLIMIDIINKALALFTSASSESYTKFEVKYNHDSDQQKVSWFVNF